ncbi:hypothetical protein [Elizabethkingia anophelis]|uniref:Immunity protein 35 domain-containing protein n=1 Tax=Elizabethkingia anophelis TaxID=1117645 RepID=A0A494JBX0_9FLAO|nr:hypothetical protein [Elizabethkingia anophelis]AQX52430.1 hypothetical protein AYC66_17875 [Elizabethkingia anophelis]MDV3554550.1 hypothetical protein [Elizabethkingia anophelis]MDV3612687.1 hypothetical protein [Elizabethkingia anophelis]MDV3651771.1 hypothetical protein [Elizabethkingia anophelis]MDV3888463.1 hypothetical protein [Elizabethkingia anophelis]
MKLTKENLEDIAREVCLRLEKEYYFYEVQSGEKDLFLGTDCLVSPPGKDEFYMFHGEKKVETFIVHNVAHSFANKQAGYIYLKRLEEVPL